MADAIDLTLIRVIAGLSIENVHPIIAADFSPARRALTLRMGADIVVDPAGVSPYRSWHDAAMPEGYDGSRYAQFVGRGQGGDWRWDCAARPPPS